MPRKRSITTTNNDNDNNNTDDTTNNNNNDDTAEPKAKRSRADVSMRRAQQKLERSSTITMGLLTVLQLAVSRTYPHLSADEQQQKTKVQQAKIESFVNQISRAAVLASWLVHHFLISSTAEVIKQTTINQGSFF
jgi:hypothetical protein